MRYYCLQSPFWQLMWWAEEVERAAGPLGRCPSADSGALFHMKECSVIVIIMTQWGAFPLTKWFFRTSKDPNLTLPEATAIITLSLLCILHVCMFMIIFLQSLTHVWVSEMFGVNKFELLCDKLRVMYRSGRPLAEWNDICCLQALFGELSDHPM